MYKKNNVILIVILLLPIIIGIGYNVYQEYSKSEKIEFELSQSIFLTPYFIQDDLIYFFNYNCETNFFSGDTQCTYGIYTINLDGNNSKLLFEYDGEKINIAEIKLIYENYLYYENNDNELARINITTKDIEILPNNLNFLLYTLNNDKVLYETDKSFGVYDLKNNKIIKEYQLDNIVSFQYINDKFYYIKSDNDTFSLYLNDLAIYQFPKRINDFLVQNNILYYYSDFNFYTINLDTKETINVREIGYSDVATDYNNKYFIFNVESDLYNYNFEQTKFEYIGSSGHRYLKNMNVVNKYLVADFTSTSYYNSFIIADLVENKIKAYTDNSDLIISTDAIYIVSKNLEIEKYKYKEV